jgi:RNA polymerase sigma-54 factor
MGRLSMHAGLELRADQRLLLQPRMLQSIEILQLPAQDLESWLAEAVLGNEALRLEPPEPVRPRGGREATDAYDEMLRNHPDRAPSLAERVELQLALADLAPAREEWVRFLIGCLDERGYLSTDDATLLALAEGQGLAGGAGALGAGIAALQELEPPGLGARDAIEALLLQLDPADPDYPTLCTLLEEYIEDLARNKLPAVARSLSIELSELTRLLGELRDLEPRPAAELASRAAPTLTPDVVVEEGERGWEVRVERGALPALSLDPAVHALAQDKGQPTDVRRYLRKKLEEARWVVEGLEQRHATLLRVAQVTFAHQARFLRDGPGHLAPLRMTDVAQELGLAVSTVSRAVAGKYAQTPWGVLPLRGFFQSSAGGDDGTARDEVRERVRAVIGAEDPTQPLSDDEVVAALRQHGHTLARRTVAKYRKELGIPSSYRRRHYGA